MRREASRVKVQSRIYTVFQLATYPIYQFVADLFPRRWRPYDPAWLVALSKNQKPKDKWLHQSLAQCVSVSGDIPMLHFVNPRKPNRPGSEWQFKRNITLEDPQHGELILDILKDNRVGGVEFLGVILKD